MSFTSTTNRMNYTGNGSTATYAYTFKIFESSDLLVTVRNVSTGVETTLVLNTDYSVTGVGSGSGGNVVLIDASQAWIDGSSYLDSGWALSIRRVRPLTQETDIRNQGSFYPETHEDTFDHLVMIDQQQQDELDRSVKLSETIDPSDFDAILPADFVGSANTVLMTNATGDGFEVGPTANDISSAQSNAQLAQDWATKTNGQVASTDYSSKAWAIGGTGVTDTASRGAAKEWAIETASTVDGTEFSAKEYAQGSQAATGGSAKNWATQTGSDVTGASAGDMSSKEWAVGTLGRGVSGEGSSKDWATYTGGTVDNAGYSAKEHAQGTQTRGQAGGGSAKDWATYMGGTVDNAEYSAKYYADDAAASAAAAASVVAAAIWNDVTFKSFADTPIAITDGDTGTLFEIDCSGGNVVVNLPQISTLTLSNPWTVGIRKSDSSANTVTINPFAGENINQAASAITLDTQNQGVTLVPDTTPAPDNWSAMQYGDLKNLKSPTITTPTINGGTYDFGTASNTNKLVLPAETTANLNGLTDDAGFLAYDTTRQSPVYNDGTNWREFGGGSGVGSISYFEGIDLGVDTTNISTYDDTGAYVDGTGGSPAAITIARNTSSPLDADGDLKITKAASSATGEGVTFLSDTIDIADRGRKLWISFEWDGTAANYVSNDFKIYAYDVTNSAIVQVIPVTGASLDTTNNVPQLPNLRTKVMCYVTPASTCTQIRVSLHCLTDNASASTYDVEVARPRLSPEAEVPGAIVTPWTSFTPTLNSTTSVATSAARWRRVGDNMEVQCVVTFNGAGGASDFFVTIPNSLTIDTAKLAGGTNTQNDGNTFGQFFWDDAGTGYRVGTCAYRSTTTVAALLDSATTLFQTSSTATGDSLSVNFSVPISSWSSSAALSTTEIGLQTIQVTATCTGTHTSTGNWQDMSWTESKDNYASFDGTTFTVPKSARYRIIATQHFASNATGSRGIRILKNGTYVALAPTMPASTSSIGNTAAFYEAEFVRGDLIKVQGFQNSGGNLAYGDGTANPSLSIAEIPDFTVFGSYIDNADVELVLDSGNGHGSTNTKIRRFTNIRKQTGNGVYYDYADSAGNGMSITIRVPGLYEFNYTDRRNATSSTQVGISVNGTALTTNIIACTYAQGRRAAQETSAATYIMGMTKTLRLSAGDIVRAHTDGGADNTTDGVMFSMIRVGP